MPTEWGGVHSLGDSEDIVTLEVNNVLVQKRINNVFGLIKGFVDPGKEGRREQGGEGGGMDK